MFVVAVRETDRWYLCENELEVALLVKQLLADFPQDKIIVAEQWQLTVLDGEVTVIEVDEEAGEEEHDWVEV
ncbi:MAG: hypothetical protein ACYCX4_07370 [Bacillota bacterium]